MTGGAVDSGSARSRRRMLVVQGIGLSLMAILGGRLWYLQAVASDAYAAAATANTIREVVTPAPRGLILDDVGRPLVRNRTQLEVTLDRSELARQSDRGTAVLGRLALVLGTGVEDLKARIRPCGAGVTSPCWNGSPQVPVPVATDADPAIALEILERRELYPGVTATEVSARNYPSPMGANLAHVLGYLQPAGEADVAAQRAAGLLDVRLGRADLVGRAGLEKQYDALLRGTPGVAHVTVDHLGRVLAPVDETPATAGNNLVTTIDAKVQAIAERELQAAITRARTVPDFRNRTYPADSGAIVVMDVRTGAIVAMASAPTYNPASWVGGIDVDTYQRLTSEKAGTPLLSRAFAASSSPGSTFKVISTAAAAGAGYDLKARYPCSRSYTVGDQTFTNFESESYGAITLARALEVSCDTVFYRIAHEMWLRDGGISPVAAPADPMQTMARAFGLGRPTGIDLPGEDGGRIADRGFKERYWEQTREATCARAEAGYPELATKDKERAEYLHALDVENCVDGAKFRAGDAVNFAIGQGDTLVTPLQLARVYAAVANGGTLWRPQVARAELSPDGGVVRTFEPIADGSVGMPQKTLDYLRTALVGVSARGTAAGVFNGWPLTQYPVGAKTGTAERFDEEPTSWFAGFAGSAGKGSAGKISAGKGSAGKGSGDAAGKPRYAVVMTVSHGGTGSGTSGPGVRAVISALLGVDGKPALPAGNPPVSLPAVRPDGTFGRPE